MQLRTAFVGVSSARSKRVISAIRAASEAELTAVHLSGQDNRSSRLTDEFHAVFIDRSLKDAELEAWLSTVRRSNPGLPVILIYQSEPDGRAFLLASRYDCWLFGEADRMGRTLSPAELGEALVRSAAERSVEHRLMAVSLSAGPCSTGT
jgi:hypothetical protein